MEGLPASPAAGQTTRGKVCGTRGYHPDITGALGPCHTDDDRMEVGCQSHEGNCSRRRRLWTATAEHPLPEGQSGNPNGRPRAPKAEGLSLEEEPLLSAVHERTSKTVRMREGDTVSDINIR